MLSTLYPALINTTPKSVESKQGICSSKPNAQPKLHAQKHSRSRKKMHEFLLVHNTFNPSQTRFDRRLSLQSCSTTISYLPCSFTPLHAKWGDKFRKRKNATRETAGDLRVWIRSAGLVVWRSEQELHNAMRSWHRKKVRDEVPHMFPPSSRCSPSLWSNGEEWLSAWSDGTRGPFKPAKITVQSPNCRPKKERFHPKFP